MDRRTFLHTSLAGTAAVTVAGCATTGEPAGTAGREMAYQDGKSPWPLIMNASTIRPVPVDEKIKVCAKAGWDGLELWTRDLEEWEGKGRDLKELKDMLDDNGLIVTDVIGLWDCMPVDETEYRTMLETTTKQRLEMASKVGSQHMAVLPLPQREDFDLKVAAARYREILELGLNEFNINPAFEFVSIFKGITRMGQAAAIAMDADHPKAKIIPDTFHMFNGGCGYEGLNHIQGDFIASFHWNDLPAGSVPGTLSDKDRIYPGEGVLPLTDTLRTLYRIGYRGGLSLELFRQEHWDADPNAVAKTGVEKMRAQVALALA
jgi:sugar phosphate isomerase/epimerase